jgi:5,10-methenyltetrahydrofolate synthetase
MQRRELIAARDALPGELRADFNRAIANHLRLGLGRALGPLGNLSVGAYYPIGAEPDIMSLFPEFRDVALPSVTDRHGELTFLRYRAGGRLVHEGFGVQVPEQREVINPSILLIPCVGFKRRPDGRIDRLGYGGGFYDRTLAGSERITIGIAYALCEVPAFEALPHDRPLDALVTEQGFFGQLRADPL